MTGTTRTSRKWQAFSVVLVLVAAVAVACFFAPFSGIATPRLPRLPYHDSFAAHSAQEWTPLGGSWRIQNDAVINWSDAQGSKLITGSPDWSAYQVTSDLRLLAHGGDIGLIVRVSQAEVGTDAYKGYYVGLRSSDSSIVMGRADHSWLTDRPVSMGEQIQSGRWYRLHVVAVGCTIAVEAIDTVSGVHGYSALRDDPRHCIAKGQSGLRSTDTSSAWKNVEIRSATEADLNQLLANVPEVLHPDFPIREDDFARMRARYFPKTYPFAQRNPAIEGASGIHPASNASLQAIPLTTALALRTEPRTVQEVRLRGVITSISPFYIQDATGGVQLIPPDPGTLCIGDEVDVLGRLAGEGRGLIFVASKVEGPTDRLPLNPLSITPAQAVSGAYEGTLVELAGQVLSTSHLPDGATVLTLNADSQNFDALLQSDLFSSSNHHWQVGSTIRVRGICTIAPNQATGSSFAILVQSNSDVTVLAGPSWLVGWRLLCLVLAGLMGSGLAVYLFMQFRRSKAAAISDERERLSHEMHDTLAQSFAGVSYHLQGLRKLVRLGEASPDSLIGELDVAYEMVAGTHREASAMIAALHPSAHKDGDLLTLIQRAASNLLDKHGPEIRAHRNGDPRPLSPAIADVLFRVALEAVANVLRHSQATVVDLTMTFASNEVTLIIQDNGVGFSLDPLNLGFGLQTTQKRCSSIRARLEIESSSGHGTRLSVTARHQMHGFSFFHRFRSAHGPNPLRK
ncbi:MAG TPA: sensor histidine kinase [Acidobacteriaceae bacterium]|jgi:signal transduction histidine kinase